MILRLPASASRPTRRPCRRSPISSQHVHHGLVGAAVQRALQRADGGGDRAVEVGLRRGDDARGEGRGVEAVLGVEDQRDVERLDDRRLGHLAEAHVQKLPRSPASGRGAIGSWPRRRRWSSATTVGSFAIIAAPWPRFGCGAGLLGSGSAAPRDADGACAARPSGGIVGQPAIARDGRAAQLALRRARAGGTRRAVRGVGSSPCQIRYATSSNDRVAASSCTG